MRTEDITVNNMYKAKFTKDKDGTPVRRFTTPWLPCDLGFFRIDLSIIRPKTEKSKRYLPLGRGQAQRIDQTFANVVVFLKKELR